LGVGIWFFPHPEAVTAQAWHLFGIFITAILAVIVNALPILVAAILALSLTVLTHTLAPDQAYAGFSEGFILLIVAAFMVARGVVSSGFGQRIALLLISRFGQSTLRLGYCLAVADAIIAPAFPSNTARGAVLYPIAYSLSVDSGSRPNDGTRRRLGSFLMMLGIISLTISSALWLTAMAANPAGARLAEEFGLKINFGSWFLAALAPSLAALVIIPYVLYRIFPPVLKATPEAPGAAADRLAAMGPMSPAEWITGSVFFLMVTGWALSSRLGIDATAIAFLGLGVLMVTGVYRMDDLRSEGEALGILIWFSVLYTLSTALNQLGFMTYLGDLMANQLEGLSWPVVYAALVSLYVLIHYLFVSQSAQLLALFGIFMGVATNAGVPAELMAFMLLFATNFFAALTPQASSANVIFIGSEYITQREVYRVGGLITLANLVVFMVVGTPWLLFLGL
jgi:DASS family divalent anion:Na+ symporter